MMNVEPDGARKHPPIYPDPGAGRTVRRPWYPCGCLPLGPGLAWAPSILVDSLAVECCRVAA